MPYFLWNRWSHSFFHDRLVTPTAIPSVLQFTTPPLYLPCHRLLRKPSLAPTLFSIVRNWISSRSSVLWTDSPLADLGRRRGIRRRWQKTIAYKSPRRLQRAVVVEVDESYCGLWVVDLLKRRYQITKCSFWITFIKYCNSIFEMLALFVND